MADQFKHVRDKVAAKKAAEKEFALSQEALKQARKTWLADRSNDQLRFAYQDAISRANKATKVMWQYEK